MRRVPLTALVLLAAMTAVSGIARASASGRYGFSDCPRSLHDAIASYRNAFLVTAIGVRGMSCNTAYRYIRHLPAKLFEVDTGPARIDGVRYVVEGNGMPGYIRCVRGAREYRFAFYED